MKMRKTILSLVAVLTMASMIFAITAFAAEPVAQAATQEKTNEKSDESPILETFLKLI